jgi:hypothetical protein
MLIRLNVLQQFSYAFCSIWMVNFNRTRLESKPVLNIPLIDGYFWLRISDSDYFSSQLQRD